ncbi:hypothetical protein APHAL10511_001429 [Amanita phalloides]|nr:hypothetical protein APHAL10511_001429 [Amanita phalloides]
MVLVPEHGLTDGQSKVEAQRKQMNNERKNLIAARLFRGWEEENDEGKTILYIEIKAPGVPASETELTGDWKTEARKNGIDHFKNTFQLNLDDKHNQDEYFAFVCHDPPFATPIMWRYAKLGK